jgi:hypothetical protein
MDSTNELYVRIECKLVCSRLHTEIKASKPLLRDIDFVFMLKQTTSVLQTGASTTRSFPPQGPKPQSLEGPIPNSNWD